MNPTFLQRKGCLSDRLFEKTRRSDVTSALVEMGEFVTGQRAFVAVMGQAIRGRRDSLPIIDVDGQAIHSVTTKVPDPLLDSLDVEWVHLSDAPTTSRRAAVGSLVFRAGLLARILDLSFRHLEGRESAGEKVLRHQLVKACFVESYCAADQIRREAPQLLHDSVTVNFIEMHRSLSATTMNAAKLMGGHGFLVGAVNTFEFFSLCVEAVFGKTTSEARNVAVELREPERCYP